MLNDIAPLLQVGQPATLHWGLPGHANARHQSFLRGWRPGAFLVFDWPPAVPQPEALPDEVVMVGVRLLTPERVVAFDVPIQELGEAAAGPFVRIGWPRTAQSAPLPRENRLAMDLGATLTLAEPRGTLAEPGGTLAEPGGTYAAQVRELALDGCRLTVGPEVPPFERAELRLDLGGRRMRVQAPIAVEDCHPYGDAGALLRCAFLRLDEAQRMDLAFYLGSQLEVLARGATARAVLFVDRDAAALDTLTKTLAEAGLAAVVADDPMETMTRLREPIHGVLVVAYTPGQDDLPNLVRMVRMGHGYENVPVYIYGHDLDRHQQETLRASGASAFITLGALGDALASEIADALRGGPQPPRNNPPQN